LSYVDTSVAVALFTEDAHSARAEAWLAEGGDLTVSHWVIAEFSSALSLQRRRGRLLDEDVRQAEASFALWTRDVVIVEPVVGADIMDAAVLVQADGLLRAPDALHLAIARRLGAPVASFDANLCRAAEQAGLGLAL
jgi:predicted nucleic acid-binding protein